MYVLQAQYMVDLTVEVLKKESRNFKSVLNAAQQFVSWANNEFEKCSIDLVLEEVFPTIRIPPPLKKSNLNNVSTAPTSATSKFEYNVHNVAMDIMVTKLQQRFAKHSELSADFACLDPRNFLKELPVTAFAKLSKLLGLEKAELKNELKDFASKWEKLKLKLPETYLVQEEDSENDEKEGEITLNNENQ